MNPVLAIQDAILARLEARMPGRFARIEAFPDRPADYDFPEGEGAAAFVSYGGADYRAPDGPRGAYAPQRTLRWEVYILVRSLRGAEGGPIGAYDALDEVRRALQGQSFAGATAMVPVREALDGESAGAWRWIAEFRNSIPAPAEANFEPAPLLREGIRL